MSPRSSQRDVLTAIGILVVAAVVAALFFVWRTTTGHSPVRTPASSATETVPPTTSPLTADRGAESGPPTTRTPVASPTAPTALPQTTTPPTTAVPTHQAPAPALVLSPLEVEPDAKALGAAVVYELTNYQADVSLQDVAARVTSDRREQEALLRAASPVLHRGSTSQGVIEYAQLGGLTTTQVSLIVLVRQEIRDATGVERVETRTFDVRLKRQAPDTAWQFERLASAGGAPVPRPENLSPAATAVLDNPRITIADSARWDIYSGHTQDSMLMLVPFFGVQGAGIFWGGFLAIAVSVAVLQYTLTNPSWLASPAMVWLGSTSYGVYLWHYVFIRGAFDLALAIPATMLCAAASSYLLENPLRTWLVTYQRRHLADAEPITTPRTAPSVKVPALAV